MEMIKYYSGLMLVKYKDIFCCIDVYTRRTKYKGSLQKCEEFFDEYVNKLANRDPIFN